MTDPFAALVAYREADLPTRCDMIRAHYARQAAERTAAYDRRHGAGASARDQAEARARPMPDEIAVAFPRAHDRFGFWEWGR